MDKQKQIEEMAKDMLVYGMGKYSTGESVFTETKLREQFYHVFLTYAEYLIKNGYCKIPEGAAVIDRNENPCLSCPVPTSEREIADCSTICGAIQLGIDWKNQCRVLVRDYNRLEKDYQKVRKETAEKFAERLSEEDCSIPIKDDFIIITRKTIDEICKELTGGDE